MASPSRAKHSVLKEAVNVYWLPKEICQSSEQKESKACTLIALIFIFNYHKKTIQLSLDYPSNDLVNLFNDSIHQGNNIYDNLKERRLLKVKYLNVPEALLAITPDKASLVEWKSFFYNTDIYKTLYSNMSENVKLWYKKKPGKVSCDLNIVIIANLRAVAVVLSSKSNVALLADSHGHSPYGAVMAVAPSSALESLCQWYATQLTKDTQPVPVTCYELSFLYYLQ